MLGLSYAAIIRSHSRTDLLDDLIASLRMQTMPPSQIIIVDSSPTRAEFVELEAPDLSIIDYPTEPFNFSRAINLGIDKSTGDYVLIISSHMELKDNLLIERGFELARRNSIEAITWLGPVSNAQEEIETIVDKHCFSGNNGLSNSMSMVKKHLYDERNYRVEVFSAEDQEWTWWYLRERQGRVLRINTPHLVYRNPLHSGNVFNELKVFNETLALGYFVKRRYIYPDKILIRILRGCLAFARGRKGRAKMHWRFAWLMTKANFVEPTVQSKYF